MESKIGQCLRGQKVAESSNDVCLLQSSLNSDCLLKICDFLDAEDLIQLCKLGPSLYDLITSQYIQKKVINISELDMRTQNNRLVLKQSSIETFRMFGKFMRKIAVWGEDFGLLLDLIIQYCESDRLIEVELHFRTSTASSKTIDQAMPFFKNLRTLKLFAPIGSTNSYQLFLTKLADHESFGSNLENLRLQYFDIIDGWLLKFRSLRQLSIDSPGLLSFDKLSLCCKVIPQLRVFRYQGADDLSEFHRICVPVRKIESKIAQMAKMFGVNKIN